MRLIDWNEKRIDLVVGQDSLEIYDNFGGIPRGVLDDIHNFDLYVSGKREFRSCTRVTSALKTIMAIAHLRNLQQRFITTGEKICYRINGTKSAY